MSDFGIFQALVTKIQHINPKLKVFGQTIPDISSPYAILQLGLLEHKRIPQKIAFQKVTLILVSRYKGEAEIQNLAQYTRAALEGKKLDLLNNTSGCVVWDESQLHLEKDNITRLAHLHFTIRLRFI